MEITLTEESCIALRDQWSAVLTVSQDGKDDIDIVLEPAHMWIYTPRYRSTILQNGTPVEIYLMLELRGIPEAAGFADELEVITAKYSEHEPFDAEGNGNEEAEAKDADILYELMDEITAMCNDAGFKRAVQRLL